MSAAICYEIAYPELVRKSSQQAAFMLTVSNDTWFGQSIAPDQHMQIARMRALESQRWIIRSTNNGISGLIDPQGNVTQQAPRYTQAILTGSVQPRQGLTPFQQFGSWPVVAFSFLLCIVGLGRQKLSFNDSARSLRPNLRH
jgi:apolipoprotein N-acyltransferase